MKISPGILQQIFAFAKDHYPSETCGFLIAHAQTPDHITRVRMCSNVQDEYHQLDPVTFPSTARAAYFMDPKELLLLQKEMRESGECIRVIYHSHVDADAYFSEEDVRQAAPYGEPLFPQVDYLVMAVKQKEITGWNLYGWNENLKQYVRQSMD